jgi:hypothetical protein
MSLEINKTFPIGIFLPRLGLWGLEMFPIGNNLVALAEGGFLD